jgi:hypothetical protein
MQYTSVHAMDVIDQTKRSATRHWDSAIIVVVEVTGFIQAKPSI